MELQYRTIEDLTKPFPMASIGSTWRLSTDGVMGGQSYGSLVRETISGRPANRLRGQISLENNGGFIQMALDLTIQNDALDASAWSGIEIDIFGNNEEYGIHLRTTELSRPWQSYRQSLQASPEWRTTQLPFSNFHPHRTEHALDTRRLRRVGIIAIGRVFTADIAVGGIRLLR